MEISQKATINIDLQISKAASDSEKMKIEAVLNLVAKIITYMILKELNEDKDSLNEDYLVDNQLVVIFVERMIICERGVELLFS